MFEHIFTPTDWCDENDDASWSRSSVLVFVQGLVKVTDITSAL